MALTFGTDGIRGDAEAQLTPELVRRLGAAAARVIGADTPFYVGSDPRVSGPRIVADLSEGLRAAGAGIVDLGVVPTPAVAYWAARAKAPGAMVSASHNPWSDNGIKLFASGGRKLDDDTQAAIEAALHEESSVLDDPPPAPAVPPSEAALAEYEQHVASVVSGRRLDGMKVVLDCANGAASESAPRVFRALGAQVVALHATPDGRNINEQCGSTYPADLQAAVTAAGADVGLAFDGDADRVIAVDERGELVDGDEMLVIHATDLAERGLLTNGGVVVTVMSNLGLRHALVDAGITVVTTPVGDRSVLTALADHGLVLGGEQSGHIVFAQWATTGDGLLTGVTLVDVMRRRDLTLSALAGTMRRFPQVLENVTVSGRVDLDHADELWAAVAAEEATLGEDGRVLVRPSGTESVVRVMVEADRRDHAEAVVSRLVAAVRAWSAAEESAS